MTHEYDVPEDLKRFRTHHRDSFQLIAQDVAGGILLAVLALLLLFLPEVVRFL